MKIDSQPADATRVTTTPPRKVSVNDGQIDSQELFQGERELRIRHGAETYRLRLTGLNKLILTK